MPHADCAREAPIAAEPAQQFEHALIAAICQKKLKIIHILHSCWLVDAYKVLQGVSEGFLVSECRHGESTWSCCSCNPLCL
jgi:hypothetical protein